MKILFTLLFTAFASTVVEAATDSCWKRAYGRGAGNPISVCGDNLVKDAALCYP